MDEKTTAPTALGEDGTTAVETVSGATRTLVEETVAVCEAGASGRDGFMAQPQSVRTSVAGMLEADTASWRCTG